ncbi:DUF1538 domain-containing protein [Xanthobacter autotrophicus]|uniref:DUF1538 domain-containing protein n=1 Tax=Xanthobacter autotrophicus TaxID=280 RepID=UPI003726D03A
MWTLLKDKLVEVVRAVAPLVGLGLVLQVAIVRAPAELVVQFLAGSALAVAGMLLLFVGIDLGILPMGRFIGAEMPKRGSVTLILAVTFALAFATTLAEPDVLVLGGQVNAVFGGAVSGHGILLLIALGVAVFAAMAIARILLGGSLRRMLALAYGLVIALALLAPKAVTPLAFDAGSVTTGVLSAPVMIALAMGLSSVLAGRSAVSDGFGLLGVASVGPIILVLLAGILLS